MNTTKMPLGTAIGRLNTLQGIIQAGIANDQIRSEYRLILNALNSFEIELNMVCDINAQSKITDRGSEELSKDATEIDIFKVSAETGCCRINHDVVPEVPKVMKRRSSRRSR